MGAQVGAFVAKICVSMFLLALTRKQEPNIWLEVSFSYQWD